MQTTPNYGLKKPEANDAVNIADLNANADTLDSALTPTANPTQAPTGNGPGKLVQWVGWLANRIKAITGKTNWYDAPDITLATLAAHKTRHATGGADALAPADIGAAAASDLASHLANKASHINGNPSCRVSHSVNQSVASGSWVALAMDTESWDPDDMHDNVINNSRITIKTAGKYLIIGGVSFANNTTGYRAVGIRVNGGSVFGMQQVNAVGGTASTVVITTDIFSLATNEYIELVALQNSGSALNAEKTGSLPFLVAIKVG